MTQGGVLSKARLLILIALPLVLADCATKRAAVTYLQPPHTVHPVLGNAVRLTLAYNQQAVMSLQVGTNARWLLIGTSVLVLAVLVRLLWTTRPSDRARALGLALLIGGATGNLLDRLASSRGVVDFIDMGLGGWRFWTFNVADAGITVGAALLALAMWRGGTRSPSATGRGGVAT